MNLHSGIYLIFYSIPVVTTFTSWMLLLISYQEKVSPLSGSLRKVAILFYGISFVATFGIMILPYSPHIFAAISPFHYSALLTVPILLYHLIWVLTPNTEYPKKFSKLHYYLPILICFILLIWSLFIPFDIRVQVAENRTLTTEGYEIYSWISHSRMQVRLLFSLVYTILILRRIWKYHKSRNRSGDIYIQTTKWAKLLAGLCIVTLLVSILGSIGEGFNPYTSSLSFIVILLLAMLHIELAFKLIKGHFPSPEKEYILPKAFLFGLSQLQQSKRLDKRQFQNWFNKNKPYLDSSFSISDLSRSLNINRTYISNFINDTYNVNFSQYLNKHRLKEVESLQKLPSNKKKSVKDLVLKAGFGSYRNYLRIKAIEENRDKKNE